MHKLVLVRHGDYDRVDDQYILNDEGRRQMLALAPKLKELTAGQRAVVHTSSAPRALACAAMLAHDLDTLPFHEHLELWSGNDGVGCDPDIDAMLLLIDEWQKDYDVLILVTHLEFVERLPSRFANHAFQTSIRAVNIPKGDAGVIDCDTKTMFKVE